MAPTARRPKDFEVNPTYTARETPRPTHSPNAGIEGNLPRARLNSRLKVEVPGGSWGVTYSDRRDGRPMRAGFWELFRHTRRMECALNSRDTPRQARRKFLSSGGRNVGD